MARKFSFRKSVAVLVGISFSVSMATPISTARALSRAHRPDLTVIETFDKNGKVTRRYDSKDIQRVRGNLKTPTSGGRSEFSLPSPNDVAKIRSQLAELQKVSSKHHLDLSLTMAVLDAWVAPSREEAHRIIAALPVRILRTSEGQDVDGRNLVTTNVYVRDVLKLRISHVALPSEAPASVKTQNEFGQSGPSAETENSVVGATFDCAGDPGDCADQQDRDDGLAAGAAVVSEMDVAASDLAADEELCWYDNSCYLSHLELSAPESAPAAVDDTHVAIDAKPVVFATDLFTSMPPSCGETYVAAAIGIGWAVSAAAFTIAACISPEPVSKFAVVGLIANLEAGLAAAELGVYQSFKCHYRWP